MPAIYAINYLGFDFKNVECTYCYYISERRVVKITNIL